MTDPFQFHLHLPRTSNDIFPAWMGLMNRAKRSFRFCTWYFLPNEQIIEALTQAVTRGVKVEGIISAKTKAGFLSPWSAKSQAFLEARGVQFYQWDHSFFHAKAYWNDQGEALVGSANLDVFSCFRNIELLCQINNQRLTDQLNQQFVLWKHHL